MKLQHNFKLIDGNFSSKESREIIQNVFSSKIQFHQMKNFSAQERYGKADATATIRIPQLNHSLNEILKIIQEADEQGAQLEIQSDVVINILKKNV